jgi:adenylate kinase family enzyme
MPFLPLLKVPMISVGQLRLSVSCLMLAMLLDRVPTVLSQDSPPARPLVILIGPPLSGKTTFVTRIQKRYGVPGISVEDLIKDHAAELMKMHRGRTTMAEMRYDPAMSRYVRARLSSMDLGRGAALDGFPATQQQAGELAKMIQEFHLTPVALQLEIPDEEVRKRAASAGRQSDQPKIIEQRIKDYHREFDTLSLYYPDAKIVKIDGTQSEEKMWQAMQRALDEAKLRVTKKK